MPHLILDRVHYSFRLGAPLLVDATLHLNRGWTGLVGPNGCGKSTLLQLLAGELPPVSGVRRLLPAEARVVRCPQEDGGLDGALLGFAAAGDGRSRQLRGQLSLDPEVLPRWTTLSGGERRRWRIGAILASDPDVLLIDEPTNHLDEDARGLLLSALRRFRGLGVVVSHDRALLDGLTNTTVGIRAGRVVTWPGPYAAAREGWALADRQAEETRCEAQEAHRHALRRLADARRAQAQADAARSTRARMKGLHDSDARSVAAKGRAANGEARASRRVGLERAIAARQEERVEACTLEPLRGRALHYGWTPSARDPVVTLTGPLTVAGCDATRTLLQHLDLAVGRTEHVHLRGPNGSGKTTLLRALGARLEAAGAPVHTLAQELSREEVAADVARLRALDREARGRIGGLLAALGADPARVSVDASPGEARKLRLALGMGTSVQALLLDEPTNHLDLPSIERLQVALAAWPGALVIVSHDRAFATACTRTAWTIQDGEVRRSSGPPIAAPAGAWTRDPG